MSFIGKVVLITDASYGIGADTAFHLAKNLGASVPLTIVADVSNEAERIINETVEHFGQLNVLVNNTEIMMKGSGLQAPVSDFERSFDVNVRSVITRSVLLTKFSIPHLEKTKGNIVNITTIASLRTTPNIMTYYISKAALEQFTKCSAMDLSSKGITLNSIINPITRCTPVYETFGLNTEQAEKMLEEYKKRYPVGTVGDVYDTLAAISYLADDKSYSLLSGVLLPIDSTIA
ncbi:uncharacterized protein LOC116350877 [Contarinia nasturtii]|uniref:uncharacterized protein LOC116350877 n=1 Tax=Contarinia nasturtii TaxID=265458 RepID=UPI0012D3EBA8|nr:uncharacterized protein LOC116350877 [Contarinia nasturtii]